MDHLRFETSVVPVGLDSVGATPCLTLYKVISMAEEKRPPFPDGLLLLHGTGADQWWIGLRQHVDDAVQRAQHLERGVSRKTHLVLEITFTSLGIAYYCTQCTGAAYGFAPILEKKIFKDGTDWGVWHFHGNLPLHAITQYGEVLVFTSCREIEGRPRSRDRSRSRDGRKRSRRV